MSLSPTPSFEKLSSFRLSLIWVILSSALRKSSLFFLSSLLVSLALSDMKISCSIIFWFKLLTFSNSLSKLVLLRMIVARMSIFSSNIFLKAEAAA